jgi:peptidoglycan/LPS O-acetylase OafA/YrhL
MSRSIRILLHLSLVVFLLCLSVGGYSLDPEDPSTLDPAVPVDGGISLLLAAGAALGGRKLFVRSRESKD